MFLSAAVLNTVISAALIIALGITSLVVRVLDMFLDYWRWRSSQSDTSSVHGRIKETEQRVNTIPSHDIV